MAWDESHLIFFMVVMLLTSTVFSYR